MAGIVSRPKMHTALSYNSMDGKKKFAGNRAQRTNT